MVDLVLSVLLLPLVAPIVVLLWATVKMDGGPGFYSQKRVGKNGKPFKCWKLRTMVPNADAVLQSILEKDADMAAEWSRDQKLTFDPRITRIGGILRSTSLDELPQLWNVIRGEMSLVGPRPVTSQEIARYGEAAATVLSVRPGVSGPWQVSGRNLISYDQRVAMDHEYASKLTFGSDLKILCLTVAVVFKRTGR